MDFPSYTARYYMLFPFLKCKKMKNTMKITCKKAKLGV